jgi:dihydrofolate reductase
MPGAALHLLTLIRPRHPDHAPDSAIEQAKALAGDKVVGVNGGTIVRQCLNAGLLDEIWGDLVPVLLGGGTPFFDQLKGAPVELEGPTSVVEGIDITHLRYRVRYP